MEKKLIYWVWLTKKEVEPIVLRGLPSLAVSGVLSLLAEGAWDRWDINNDSWNMTWLCLGLVFSFLAAYFGGRHWDWVGSKTSCEQARDAAAALFNLWPELKPSIDLPFPPLCGGDETKQTAKVA